MVRSRMIVACESTLTHAYTCMPTREVWGHTSPPHLPGKFCIFRSSQITSNTIWDKLSKQYFDDTYLCPVTCKIKYM